LLHFFYKIIKL